MGYFTFLWEIGGNLIIWDKRVVTEYKTILGEFTLSIKFRNYDNSEWWLLGVYGPNRPSAPNRVGGRSWPGYLGFVFQIGA